MSVDQRPEIENLRLEERVFPPDPAFAAQANAQAGLYEEAARDPEAFWAKIDRQSVKRRRRSFVLSRRRKNDVPAT